MSAERLSYRNGQFHSYWFLISRVVLIEDLPGENAVLTGF
jgi:hypothetical protein